MHGSDSLTTGTDSNSITETLCRTKELSFSRMSHFLTYSPGSKPACTRNTHSLWHTHTYMGTWTSYRQGPGIRQNMAVVTTHTHTHTRTHTHPHTTPHHTTPTHHTTHTVCCFSFRMCLQRVRAWSVYFT